MSERCLVCGGAKVVRLPLRREVSAMFPGSSEIPDKIEETSRTYPCPECSDRVDEAQVMVLGATQHVGVLSLERGRNELREYIRRDIAHMFADKLLEENLISFSEHEPDDKVFGRAAFYARIGVVSRSATETIEKRAHEAAAKALDGVAEKAAAKIRVWGRDYSGDEGHISKGQAVQYLKEAFNEHLAEMRKKVAGKQDGE